MRRKFKNIGLFAKHNDRSVYDTFEKLIKFLSDRNYSIFIDEQSSTLLSSKSFPILPREEIGKACDLIIVVGGDGSLLNAARAIVSFNIPIFGINRGYLGFLADILPNEMEGDLEAILQGDFSTEKRFLLNASLKRPQEETIENIALNDIVLYCGNIARMIDFEVYIDDKFVLRQQADGIITATPTGSTAYALSAGGPILHPTLNAITIAPLCPHILSSRPIVVEGNSHIKFVVTRNNTHIPKLSFDGQLHFDLPPDSEISIRKHHQELTLIHPLKHEYFKVLREKLGWGKRQI